MKITDILPTPCRTRRRTGAISSHIVLQVQTDAGICGLGEISDLDCYRMMMPDLDAVRVGLLRVARGADPFQIAQLHQSLHRAMPFYIFAANSYPPFSVASQICAGLDMALYDIVGKALGTPVYNLLGGRVRDRIEVTYPIFQATRPQDVPRYLEMIESLLQRGMRRFRYYVGVDLQADELFLRTLRDRFGESIELKSIDFMNLYYWKEALQIYHRFKEYRFDLIESPSRNEDYEGMAEIRKRIDTPVSEHVSSFAQAMRMIKAGAVDVFNITIQSGGIYQAMKLFHVAEAAGLQCLISTTQEMSIGTAAAAHLGAVVPRLHFAGDPVGPLLYLEDVTREPVQYEGTALLVPDGPGLGVELDAGKLEALRGPLVEWDRPAHGADYVPL